MTKKVVVIVLSWLLVLATMLIIYNFSSETSTKSSKTSSQVVVQVLDVVMEKEDITPPVVKKFQIPFRKLAHFGIFMLLGFCMYSAYEKSFKIKLWINAVLSLVSCVLYAISDEFHQKFTDGRANSIKDVLIDSSGSCIGILLFIGLNFVYIKYLNKKRSSAI